MENRNKLHFTGELWEEEKHAGFGKYGGNAALYDKKYFERFRMRQITFEEWEKEGK